MGRGDEDHGIDRERRSIAYLDLASPAAAAPIAQRALKMPSCIAVLVELTGMTLSAKAEGWRLFHDIG